MIDSDLSRSNDSLGPPGHLGVGHLVPSRSAMVASYQLALPGTRVYCHPLSSRSAHMKQYGPSRTVYRRLYHRLVGRIRIFAVHLFAGRSPVDASCRRSHQVSRHIDTRTRNISADERPLIGLDIGGDLLVAGSAGGWDQVPGGRSRRGTWTIRDTGPGSFSSR